MRLHDLPADVQAKVRAQMGESPKKRRRDTTGTGDGQPQDYRCHTCREVFPSYTAFERHAHAAGHVRGEMVLPG